MTERYVIVFSDEMQPHIEDAGETEDQARAKLAEVKAKFRDDMRNPEVTTDPIIPWARLCRVIDDYEMPREEIVANLSAKTRAQRRSTARVGGHYR